MSENIRVLAITNTYPTAKMPGDTPAIKHQLEGLQARGVSVDLIVIDRTNPLNYFKAAAQVALLTFKRRRYDLIHAHYGHCGVLARFQPKYPIVVTFRGSDILGRKDAIYGRLAARWADNVIVMTDEMKEMSGRDDAFVIPFGANTKIFKPYPKDQARAELGLPPDAPLILFPWDPARVTKRFDIVEQMLTLLQETHPDAQVITIFDKPHEVVAQYMNACDVMVLVSHHEGSPVAVHEAIACRLPVVSVDVGDVRSVIENVNNCYIVERDPADVADHIRRVLDSGERSAIKEGASTEIDQVLEVYHLTLKQTGRATEPVLSEPLSTSLMEREKNMLRIALVGCGQIAQVHVKAVAGYDNATICAVCDRDKYRARKIAEQAGDAAVYTDFTEMLREEKPDVVHILTPPASHKALAIEAMNAGAHCLVEKPMALSAAEADEMIAAANANNVKLATNHNYLFKPSVAKAREMVASGEIGDVVYVNSYYGMSGETGHYVSGGGQAHWAWNLPGGVFTNFLPHMVYLQMEFLKNIQSVVGLTVARPGGPDSAISDFNVLLQGDNAAGMLTVSMRAKPYAKYVDIYGTKATIRADLVREVCSVHNDHNLPRMLNKVAYNLEDSMQLSTGTALNTVKVLTGSLKNMPGLHELVHRFYDSIRQGSPAPTTGEDGKRVAELMEEIWAKNPALANPPQPPPIEIKSEPETDAERTVVEEYGGLGRVLLTGATGFLGGRMLPALLRTGADVRIIARDADRVPAEYKERADVVYGDIRDPEVIKQAMQDIDVVFNCAAITTNKASWREHEEINITATENIFRAAKDAGVKRVVHTSSVIVYGLQNPPNGTPVHESSPYYPTPAKWAHYMRSKIESDRLALCYAKEHELPVTVLRLGILYGPGAGRAPGRGIVDLGSFRVMAGLGRNHLPYAYVDNVVQYMLMAAVVPEAVGEAYNIVDEPQPTIREVVARSRQITGDPIRIVPVPPALFKGMAGFFESRANKAGNGSPPKLSKVVIEGMIRDMRYDTTKARRDLGPKTTIDLTEGLRRTLAN